MKFNISGGILYDLSVFFIFFLSISFEYIILLSTCPSPVGVHSSLEYRTVLP